MRQVPYSQHFRCCPSKTLLAFTSNQPVTQRYTRKTENYLHRRPHHYTTRSSLWLNTTKQRGSHPYFWTVAEAGGRGSNLLYKVVKSFGLSYFCFPIFILFFDSFVLIIQVQNQFLISLSSKIFVVRFHK